MTLDRSKFAAWFIGAIVMSATIGCSRHQPKDITQLVEDLGQEDADARYEAVKSLGNRGAEAQPAVPALIGMLKDPHTSVCVGAEYALAKIGPGAASAVPALSAALDDSRKEVRVGAAYALPELGPDAAAARQSLQKLAARDVDPSVRKQAAKSLTKIEMVVRYRQAADARKAGQTPAGRP